MEHAEYRSRCDRVRAGMRDAGLDGLIVAGCGLIAQHGYLRYLTGYCPVIRPGYAFLAGDAAPVAIVTTESDIWLARRDGVATEMRLAVPPADGSDPFGIPTALRDLVGALGMAAPRIGVVGLDDIISAADFSRWRVAMPAVNFTPATGLVAAVKAVKSARDLAGMRQAAVMVDDGFEALAGALAAGASLRQAAGAAEASVRGAGAHEVLVYATTYPHFLHRPTAEIPGHGSLITVFVEASDADGYWIELARLIAVGPLDAARRSIVAHSMLAMDRAQAALRPGMAADAVYEVIAQTIAQAGLVSGLLFGHGIGIDHDMPAIAGDVETRLVADMVIAMHPHVVDPVREIGACLCESFVIGPDGAQPLSRLPRDLVTLP